LNNRQHLISTPNYSACRREEIEQDTCANIAHENEIIWLENLCYAKGWPAPSLTSFIKRIIPLKNQLLDFVHDLYNNIVWNDFLDVIDYKVHAFGRCEDPANSYEYAVIRTQCG
jgi:hypothetical protein